MEHFFESRLLALEEKNVRLEEELERTKVEGQTFRQDTEGKIYALLMNIDALEEKVKKLNHQFNNHLSEGHGVVTGRAADAGGNGVGCIGSDADVAGAAGGEIVAIPPLDELLTPHSFGQADTRVEGV